MLIRVTQMTQGRGLEDKAHNDVHPTKEFEQPCVTIIIQYVLQCKHGIFGCSVYD